MDLAHVLSLHPLVHEGREDVAVLGHARSPDPRQPVEPVAVEVDRTVVMMSVEQGKYFGLEGTGPRIWALLERPRSVRERS